MGRREGSGEPPGWELHVRGPRVRKALGTFQDREGKPSVAGEGEGVREEASQVLRAQATGRDVGGKMSSFSLPS